MKGVSLFYKNGSFYLHPNAYTENGFGRAIPPFQIMKGKIEEEKLLNTILGLLDESESNVPFRMPTEEELENYRRAFGSKQMGLGVHLTQSGDAYTIQSIDRRGRFGNACFITEEALMREIKTILGLTNAQLIPG